MINKFKQIYQKHIYDKFRRQQINYVEEKYKDFKSFYDDKTKFSYSMKLLELCKNDEEKIDIINVVTDMIINEIKYDYMACFIYCEESNLNLLKRPFPLDSWDENRTIVEGSRFPEKREVGLEKDRIIPSVWHRKRAVKSILDKKDKDFIFREDNHEGIYYTYLDICHIYNGNHSTMAGIVRGKQGKMLVDEIDITNLFPYVDTDGENWIHEYNKNDVKSVFDYRLAVIYKMNKIKYEIEHKED